MAPTSATGTAPGHFQQGTCRGACRWNRIWFDTDSGVFDPFMALPAGVLRARSEHVPPVLPRPRLVR